MCAEANTLLRAVAVDLFFNCWYLEIHSDNCIMRKAFDWKPSRISMLEVEAVPQTSGKYLFWPPFRLSVHFEFNLSSLCVHFSL
jgi:hypothetical protein